MKKMNMKMIHDIPAGLEKLFNTKPFSVIFSVVCSVLIWFSISMTAYKTTHATFYNIPLDVELTGTLAEANGLSAVSCDVEKVNVEIEGNRAQIGRITEEDLKAYLQIGNISTTGEFYFEIGIESEKNIPFSAANVTPSHATVKLDKIESQTYDVAASFPNLRVSSGHALDQDDVVCDPAVIEITGPSEQLSKIDHVEVYSNKSVEIDSLYILYTSEVKLYTAEGALMDADDLEMENTNFQVTIPVLTQKELELTYEIRNVPSGFDLAWLKERLHLSEESITLASQTNTTIADRDTWNVGYVTLDDIPIDFSKEFEISLDEDYINQSGFQNVTLTLDNEGLASKEIWVSGSNISIINAPKNYEYQIFTRSMPIIVVGEAEQLEDLSLQDIIVTVDLLNYNVAQNLTGSPDATVSFYSKSTDDDDPVRMWAVGSYRVALSFEETEEETTGETQETQATSSSTSAQTDEYDN